MLLFVPLGFIVTLKFNKIDRLYKVLLIGFFSSLVIEVIQITLQLRTFDVDDIILNSLGTILGFGFLKLSSIDRIFKDYRYFREKGEMSR
ncbi:VanZ family protein [Ureibacillus acetophenoni]